jgi:hypothetical protein
MGESGDNLENSQGRGGARGGRDKLSQPVHARKVFCERAH